MSPSTLHKAKARENHGKAVSMPLRNGEHLSREEYERRWDATPGLLMAELIEGIVFVRKLSGR